MMPPPSEPASLRETQDVYEVSDPQWRDQALCATGAYSLNLWFDQPRTAKLVCRICPVIGDCRGWALSLSSQDGVAGGLTERERRKIRGQRRRDVASRAEEESA